MTGNLEKQECIVGISSVFRRISSFWRVAVALLMLLALCARIG